MKTLKTLRTHRIFALTVAVLVAVVALGLWGLISVSYADGGPAPYTLSEAGYLDFSYGPDVAEDHTSSRPESKLWWNDGYWWGSMWNDELDEFHIYRLNWGTQTWQDTGVPLDDRPDSRADVLWDGTNNKLYVASHFQQDNPSQVNSESNWGRLYRFTYDEAVESYTLDSGFPVTINKDKTNTLVIDKDSAGRLWTTYVSRRPQQGIYEHQVYVNATTGPSADDSWLDPFPLATLFPKAYVDVDDISTIVAFDDKVGVMWTNQLSGTLHMALHDAGGDLTTGWVTETVPISGTIDNHVSVKAHSSGALFAAIKTEALITETGKPLVGMVARSASGDYSFHEYSAAEHNDTRPILLIDEESNHVYIFVTGKPDGSFICYKAATITTPLSNMAFTPGDCGTEFISDGEVTYESIDSATTAKHSVDATSGLAVLATNDITGTWVYVHNVIGDPPPVLTNRSPAPGQADVPLDTLVMATFSHQMNETTLNDTTFTLEDASGSVGGSVGYESGSQTATFTPTAPLNAYTEYTATVTQDAKDLSGRSLYGGAPEVWSFTTVSPTVSFAKATYSVLEDAGLATVTVTLNAPSSISATVDFATSDGSATTVDNDYTATSGTLTFDPGEVSKSFTVPILDDGADELNETVALTLSNAVNASLGTSESVLTIVDDEGDPTVQFDPSSISVGEGAGSAEVKVTLSHSSVATVTVNYASSDSTATAGEDYSAVSGALEFAPGDTEETFSISIGQDALDEEDETLTLTLSGAVNAILGAPDHTATLTIVDDDAPPKVAFSSASYSEDENAGVATIEVSLSAESGRQVSVDYATSIGTATPGSDYTPASGTLTFNAGETTQTFTVPLLNNDLNEPSETVQLALSNPNKATLGTPSNATLTINDDDPMPTVTFDAASYVVDEDAGTATITVILSGPSGQTTAVDYATGDGTATVADGDYAAASGTLEFDVGDTSASFTVSIGDDDKSEPDETITLTLSNPDDLTLGTPSSVTLTIVDDDGFSLYLPVIAKP